MTANHTRERDDFDRAMALRDRGRRRDAAVLLLRLRRRDPNDAAVCAMLGELFWEEKQLARAALWFRKATELSPRSELASLGLFHVLWEMGKERAAVAEMKRFRRLGHSSDYEQIARDLAVKSPTSTALLTA